MSASPSAPKPEVFSRRQLVERGLFGGALLSAAVVLPSGCAGYHSFVKAEERSELRFFSVKEFAVLLAAADALLPDDPAFPNHRELGTALKLDHELAQWEPVRSQDVPILMSLLEHGTVLFAHSFSRMSRLSIESRRQYLAAWGASSMSVRRSGFLALKGLLSFYYYSDPLVWETIGYDGPWLGQFEIPIIDVGLPG
jgi:hypothetical protein